MSQRQDFARALQSMQRGVERRTPAAVAQRAALRRGLRGFGHDARADAVLLRFYPAKPAADGGPPPWLEHAALVAALVATTDVPVALPDAGLGRRSLGRDLYAVKSRRPLESYERVVRDLLDADRDRLARPLRRALTLMRADGGTLDVEALMRDLEEWDRDDRRAQRRWAFHFWTAADVRDHKETTTDPEVPA